MAGSGLNRISIVVPGSSSGAAAERDGHIHTFTLLGISTWLTMRYLDTNSGLGAWGYYAVGYGITNGIVTVASVTCTGMATPPSGSNLVAMADPGVGTLYTWTAMGAPFGIRTSGDGSGGSIPQGNNNYYVWNIPGNSTTAVAYFTEAISVVSGQMPPNITQHNYKYVDAVSGAWQVWAIWVAPGLATTAAATSVANSNILYIVTCSGTPHPPTGSSAPAVTLPAFTQTFVLLPAPVNFGPMR
jgi:hypothetical protein